jgi:CBS domain containing-hemolysin-like protein
VGSRPRRGRGHLTLGSLNIAALVCLGFGFICAIFARALTAFSKARLEALIAKYKQTNGNAEDRADRAVSRERLIAQSASVSRGLFGVAYAVLTILDAVGREGGIDWETVGLWLALWVVAGELLPRIIGTSLAQPIVLRWGWAARWLLFPTLVFGKIVFFGAKIADRLRGKIETGTEEKEFEDEIRAVVAEGTAEGVIEENEGEMIESVLRLRDADVAEIMTPRTDMVSISADMDLAEAIRIAAEAGHSRVPTYEGNRDNIIGIFYVKDLLHHWGETPAPALKAILRKPHFIPESRKVSGLLEELKRANVHIAVVLDEYGGTAGVVTVEDIVEEVVGEIKDEFDYAREPTWQRVGEDTIESDARVHVDEINEELSLSLPEAEDYDTVGGLVTSLMGRIPSVGEKVRTLNAEFEVLDADQRRIKHLRIRHLDEEE